VKLMAMISIVKHASLSQTNSEHLGIICTMAGQIMLIDHEKKNSANLNSFHSSILSRGERISSKWLLVYFLYGNGVIHVSPDKIIEIHEGVIILLAPDTRYMWLIDPSKPLNAFYTEFGGESIREKKVCTAIGELYPSRTIGLHIEVVEFFQRMLSAAEENTAGSQREAGSTIVLLVALIVNCVHQYNSKKTLLLSEKAKVLMKSHLKDQITIKSIAQELHIPISSFIRLFKQETTETPYHYFLKQKIEAVKMVLAEEDLPLRVIAESYGFTDQYHLSKVFYRIVGKRPVNWRKEAHIFTVLPIFHNPEG
jgi:AraC-like DNA-binding protein